MNYQNRYENVRNLTLEEYRNAKTAIAVVLSVPLMIEGGQYIQTEVSKKDALEFIEFEQPTNYSGHETTRLVGLEPSKTRETCIGYSQALVVRPLSRLEFGREYSVEEIEAIGVKYLLVTFTKADQFGRY